MLEDESGRIRLVGDVLKGKNLVTGIIIGALGAETPEGDFEVVDICFAGLAPQAYPQEEGVDEEDTMDVDGVLFSVSLSQIYGGLTASSPRYRITGLLGRRVDWCSFWIGSWITVSARCTAANVNRVSNW